MATYASSLMSQIDLQAVGADAAVFVDIVKVGIHTNTDVAVGSKGAGLSGRVTDLDSAVGNTCVV